MAAMVHEPLPRNGSAVSARRVVQPLDVGDDRRHLVDGVDAALRRGAVRRAALGADLDLHPPAVPAVDAELRRLGDDHDVRLEHLLAQDVLPAEAVAVLLHHRAGDPELRALEQPQLLGDARAVHRGRDAALLVAGAAAVDHAVLQLALVRVARPRGRGRRRRRCRGGRPAR